MTAKDMAQQVRAELKALGINNKQVSVTSKHGDLQCEIKDLTVSKAVVEEIAKKHESIQRCEYTGEILCGGNTYVSVDFSWDAIQEAENGYEAEAKGFENANENQHLRECGRYVLNYSKDGRYNEPEVVLLKRPENWKERTCYCLENVARYDARNWQGIAYALVMFDNQYKDIAEAEEANAEQKEEAAPEAAAPAAPVAEEAAAVVEEEEETAAPSKYEERQEARRERYLELAAKARAEGAAAHKRVQSISSHIPLGQPILCGHHSERRYRADIARMERGMDAALAASKKEEYYLRKAESVGCAGISSDDENAVAKLKAKLEDRQQMQERMKKVNALIRKGDSAGLIAIVGEANAAKIQKPDFCGRIGFPAYALQNNNAEISRLKKRIEQLERAAAREDVEEECDGYTYKEEENRCQFVFPGKPDEETRTMLKSNGFKWSPSRLAWVRQATPNGRAAAARVKAAL